MATSFPQQVLSDTMRRAFGSRTVSAAVFLTFRFEPAFFEAEVLPLLFDRVFSHAEKVRLAQLEELLPKVKLAVYFDRNGLETASGSARLDYRRIAVGRTTGYFHPKNIMLLVDEPQEEGETLRSLLLVTLSANLTRAGWWENVEVVQVEEVQEGKRCPFRRDLLELFGRLRQEDRVDTDHEALEEIRSFMDRRIEDAGWQKKDGRLRPQLYVGHGKVADFLRDRLPRDDYHLEVISPYHAEGVGTLEELLEVVQPKETRILVPITSDGLSVGCTPEYYRAVAALPGVSWATLPVDVLGTKIKTKGEKPRFVHAKLYRFWNRDTAFYLVGSVNLTAAAFSTGRAGNFETAVLVEPEPQDRPGWLLEAVESTQEPASWKPQPFEEGEREPVALPFHLRFDWSTGELHYYWEDPESVPASIDVTANGVPKFTIISPSAVDWVKLDANAADAMKQLLASTSFVDVKVDQGQPFPVLVREEGMGRKPSLVQTLTVEEILLYWSLLSPEQKEHFLSLRIPLGDAALPISGAGSLLGADSMFGQFAGIYHAFGRLETEIWYALRQGERPVADYRLFGAKHDSLPTLLERLQSDASGDPVNRYVIALCALQLMKRLRRDFPDYCTHSSPALRDLAERIHRAETVRDALAFDTAEERQRFLGWFDRMFLMEMQPLPQGDAP